MNEAHGQMTNEELLYRGVVQKHDVRDPAWNSGEDDLLNVCVIRRGDTELIFIETNGDPGARDDKSQQETSQRIISMHAECHG